MKKLNAKFICGFITLLSLVLCMSVFTACELPKDELTRIKLSKNELTLTVGKSETLTFTTEPSDLDVTVTWETSKSAVATVVNGKVTAAGEGYATITITAANGVTDTCAVTVKLDRDQAIAKLNGLIADGDNLVDDYESGLGAEFTGNSLINLKTYLGIAEGFRNSNDIDEIETAIKDLEDAIADAEKDLPHYLAAKNFKETYVAVLSKTVDAVETTDRDAVDAALDAYGALANEVKTMLTDEKTLLDDLSAKIFELELDVAKESKLNDVPSLDSLTQTDYTVASWTEIENAISADIAAINGFTTIAEVEGYAITANLNTLVLISDVVELFQETHSVVLAKTIDDIAIADKAAVDAALTAYDALADEVQVMLSDEKELLDTLSAKIIEFEEALAGAKESKLNDVPSLDSLTQADYTVASWTEFENAVNADIAAINGFTTVEEVEGYAITADAGVLVLISELVESFESEHATVLALTIDSVEIANKDAVDAALEAYGALLDEVKAMLTDEKTLLDALSAKILELEEQDLADAKLSKLNDVPSLDSLTQADYTVASWTELENAINADKAAINGFTTVEEVEDYELTADIDMLVLIDDVVNEFKSEYARVLALTTISVRMADKNDLEVAFAAFSELPEEVRAKMSTQNTKFNSLRPLVDAKLAKYADLLNIEDYEADKADYTTDSWETFAFAIYVDTLFIDTATTTTALTGYNFRTTEDLLVEVADVIETFETAHAQVLGLTDQTIGLEHKDSLLAAIAEYYWLSDETAQGVNASVGTNVKAKLESLLAKLSTIDTVTVTASDSAELLNALKVSTAYNIYIPNGTYNLAAFQITSAKNIVGESMGGVIINITGHTSSQAALVIKTNSILRNLTIVADSDYAAIKVTTIGNGFVDRVVFENVKILGSKGLNIHGVLSAALINVEVDNVLASHSIALSIAESNVTIIDSNFSSGKYGSIGIMYGSSYTTGYTLKIDDKTAVSNFVYLETYKTSGYTVLVPETWSVKTGTIALKSNNMIFTSESIEKAAEFIEKHSAVAELTLETVGIEHIGIIEAAIAEYELLDTATQKLLKAAKEYADILLAKAQSLL